jgi:ABC-2 type transport system permease protein
MEATPILARQGTRARMASLRHQARVVHVIAASEFKLKYSDSALGYLWSLLKPLGLFTMLYIVFGRFFKLSSGIQHYPLYLIIGIVLWTYFADGTTLAMASIVSRNSLISKLSFPRLIIPVSITITAALTLAVNLLAVVAFIAGARIVPDPDWMLLPLLLLELYLVTLGVGLILATLYVRLRDIGQVWELLLQLLFYASPIIYPAGFLPPWFKPIAFLSPFVQIVQDARAIIFPSNANVTAATVYGSRFGDLLPMGIGLALLVGGYLLFRREEPRFAERT